MRGERITLRPLDVADAPRLAELAAHPEVARWWPELDERALVEKAEGRGDATGFVIEHAGEPIGLAQYHEEHDPQYRHAGIDVLVGEPWQGQGLGTDAVRTLARHLVDERGHQRLVIDPAAENERAIRAYEKVGFRRVGVMRRYWRTPDGRYHDGLLMDLLAEELR